MKIHSIVKTANFAMLFAFTELALAAGGLGKVNTFMEKLADGLPAISIATCIVAILVTGYKVMFNGDSIRDCKNWIIGGVLIADSAEIAKLLLS